MRPWLWGLLLAGMMLILGSTFALADTGERLPAQVPATDSSEMAVAREEEMAAPSGTADDEALEARVTNALLRNPYVDKYQIGVAVVDGMVTLSGTVNTAFEKARAEDTVASVPGVMEIQNNLRVRPE